ncbi:ORF30 [Felid gammaherpesvirus 1]|uniref:ORF30 n=1 Tax=Felid gammaherpesvirus 1 TaxID=2560468 RepID=A0A0M3T963_9GAMA|nr:ORF30 [Felis catus gammaherpesvirus 1]ALE14742.1 ORF30 [Felis catus gammaherpesvirus 1]
MPITEKDFIHSRSFFNQQLPSLFHICSQNLGSILLTQTAGQKVEKLNLLLDLVGTECIKEVNFIQDVDLNVDGLKVAPSTE